MFGEALRKVVVVCTLVAILAACGGNAAPETTSVSESPGTTAGFTTSTGFACPEPAQKAQVTSTELNLFVWTEYIPQDIIECFEGLYGVKINKDEYSSNEEMYAKLSAGGSTYDLVQPTDYIVSLMIRQGLLQKIDKSKLTIMDTFDANYMDLPFDPGNEYTLPYQAGTDAIIYNADTVSDPPTSWEDLWKPEYAGKMIALDDSRVLIGATLLTLGYSVNTTDAAQLNEAKGKLAELVKGIKIFDSDSPKTALIAGDVDLGITWTGEAFLAQQENPAFVFVYPKEGAIVWQDNWAIPAEAPHLDAVYAWLNYSMQPDLFWMMLREFPYNNPSKATLDYAKDKQSELYNAYMDSSITNTPVEALQNGHRIEDVGEALPLYDKVWTEVKGGQ